IYGYRIYNLEPSGIRFRPAAKIRMLYDDSQIDQGEAWLAIVKRENDRHIWRTIPTKVDDVSNIAVGELDGFSQVGISITCGNPTVNENVYFDTEFMYLAGCEPCLCFEKSGEAWLASGTDGSAVSCSADKRCGVDPSMNVNRFDNYKFYWLNNRGGGTTSYFTYGDAGVTQEQINDYKNNCKEGCDQEYCDDSTLPVCQDGERASCKSKCDNLLPGWVGCAEYDWDGDGDKELGYPNAAAAGGKGEFIFKIDARPGDCIDDFRIEQLFVDDSLSEFKLNGYGVDKVAGAQIKTEWLKFDGQVNTFSVTVQNTAEACAAARMLFMVSGVSANIIACNDADAPGKCCLRDGKEDVAGCDFPVAGTWSTITAGLAGAEECKTPVYAPDAPCKGKTNLCAVANTFQILDKMIAQNKPCDAGWCCGEQPDGTAVTNSDTITCCESGDKIIFEVHSESPYAWVIGKLNGGRNVGVRPDLIDSVAPGYWWAYEYPISELKPGTNYFSFLKDADLDTLDMDTKKCARAAITYEGNTVKVFSGNIATEPEDIPQTQIDDAKKEPAVPASNPATKCDGGWPSAEAKTGDNTQTCKKMGFFILGCQGDVDRVLEFAGPGGWVLKTYWDGGAEDAAKFVNYAYSRGLNPVVRVIFDEQNQKATDAPKYVEFINKLFELTKGTLFVQIGNEPNIHHLDPIGYRDLLADINSAEGIDAKRQQRLRIITAGNSPEWEFVANRDHITTWPKVNYGNEIDPNHYDYWGSHAYPSWYSDGSIKDDPPRGWKTYAAEISNIKPVLITEAGQGTNDYSDQVNINGAIAAFNAWNSDSRIKGVMLYTLLNIDGENLYTSWLNAGGNPKPTFEKLKVGGSDSARITGPCNK
ncbi:MAG: hypothetical protein ABIG95_06100, partial [Candidatus Woesearchaeota archaeon]